MTIDQDRKLTLLERAERNVDHAAIAAKRRAEAARATTERIAGLRANLFDNAVRESRVLDALANEAAAARLLISAHNSADTRLVLGILRVAMDNGWDTVVETGIRRCLYGPTADSMQELWTLTTARAAD